MLLISASKDSEAMVRGKTYECLLITFEKTPPHPRLFRRFFSYSATDDAASSLGTRVRRNTLSGGGSQNMSSSITASSAAGPPAPCNLSAANKREIRASMASSAAHDGSCLLSKRTHP